MRVVGLMSGTSFDAIDAAVADIELEEDVLRLRTLGSISAPYADELRDEIAAALPPAQTTLETVCRLDTRIGQAFAELAAEAVTRFGGADLIASHGQTLFHWVEDGRVSGTLQVGQPAWIAERTGLPVVADLRAPEDVLATLTRLTARTVAHAARGVTEIVASGGGVRNATLMAALAEEIAPASLITSDALGLPAQDKEAIAFAVLGFLTFHGLPGTLPSATGARHASVLGAITPAPATAGLPRSLTIAP